jgi:hypothetical protein
VLPERLELSTSPLPRECSTTELRQRPAPSGLFVTAPQRGPSDSRSGHDCKRNLDLGRVGDYIGHSMTRQKQNPPPGATAKADRLADALRENLRKRKAQARARAAGHQDDSAPCTETAEIRPQSDTETGEAQ